MSFQCESFGKWILAGEHTVLRGGAALVFPLYDHKMHFKFDNTDKEFAVVFSGPRGEELALIFFGLLENMLKRLGKSRSDLKGRLEVTSSLRLGAGMGASAALCVGLTRVFHHLGWLSEENLYEFSRQSENLFHGESSGVDIAVALEGKPLRFLRGGEWKSLQVQWKPNWYLSYSGQRGVTAECVKKVKGLIERQPEIGNKLDQMMMESSEMAAKALESSNPKEAQAQLARAMDLAASTFNQWGLCEGRLGQHMKDLQKEGALSVKPTGSGGGGYVISLWSEAQDREDLIPL